jgi:hypothetical protein
MRLNGHSSHVEDLGATRVLELQAERPGEVTRKLPDGDPVGAAVQGMAATVPPVDNEPGEMGLAQD